MRTHGARIHLAAEKSATSLAHQALNARTPSPARASATAPATATASPGGEPLPEPMRADAEARFGHDFGHVRIHDDASARRSADTFGARAFALGDDIAWSARAPAWRTPAARGLLFHELSHVTQARRGHIPHGVICPEVDPEHVRRMIKKNDEEYATAAPEDIPRLEAEGWFWRKLAMEFQPMELPKSLQAPIASKPVAQPPLKLVPTFIPEPDAGSPGIASNAQPSAAAPGLALGPAVAAEEFLDVDQLAADILERQTARAVIAMTLLSDIAYRAREVGLMSEQFREQYVSDFELAQMEAQTTRLEAVTEHEFGPYVQAIQQAARKPWPDIHRETQRRLGGLPGWVERGGFAPSAQQRKVDVAPADGEPLTEEEKKSPIDPLLARKFKRGAQIAGIGLVGLIAAAGKAIAGGNLEEVFDAAIDASGIDQLLADAMPSGSGTPGVVRAKRRMGISKPRPPHRRSRAAAPAALRVQTSDQGKPIFGGSPRPPKAFLSPVGPAAEIKRHYLPLVPPQAAEALGKLVRRVRKAWFGSKDTGVELPQVHRPGRSRTYANRPKADIEKDIDALKTPHIDAIETIGVTHEHDHEHGMLTTANRASGKKPFGKSSQRGTAAKKKYRIVLSEAADYSGQRSAQMASAIGTIVRTALIKHSKRKGKNAPEHPVEVQVTAAVTASGEVHIVISSNNYSSQLEMAELMKDPKQLLRDALQEAKSPSPSRRSSYEKRKPHIVDVIDKFVNYDAQIADRAKRGTKEVEVDVMLAQEMRKAFLHGEIKVAFVENKPKTNIGHAEQVGKKGMLTSLKGQKPVMLVASGALIRCASCSAELGYNRIAEGPDGKMYWVVGRAYVLQVSPKELKHLAKDIAEGRVRMDTTAAEVPVSSRPAPHE